MFEFIKRSSVKKLDEDTFKIEMYFKKIEKDRLFKYDSFDLIQREIARRLSEVYIEEHGVDIINLLSDGAVANLTAIYSGQSLNYQITNKGQR